MPYYQFFSFGMLLFNRLINFFNYYMSFLNISSLIITKEKRYIYIITNDMTIYIKEVGRYG